jgi:hypothetical protein
MKARVSPSSMSRVRRTVAWEDMASVCACAVRNTVLDCTPGGKCRMPQRRQWETESAAVAPRSRPARHCRGVPIGGTCQVAGRRA